MKKIMFAVMAMFAIGFTSCGNKTQAPADNAEAMEEVTYNAEDEAAASISALTEQIEAQDASKLQEVLTSIQEKIKEFLSTNPEAAKLYVTKVQEFLKENAEKIKAFAGDNEMVTSAINSLTAAPAESIVNGLNSAVDGMNQAGAAAVDTLNKAGKAAVESVKEDAKQKANEAIDKGADKLKKGLGL